MSTYAVKVNLSLVHVNADSVYNKGLENRRLKRWQIQEKFVCLDREMRLLHPGRANSAKNMNEITDLVLYWSERPVYFECERYTRKGQELGRIWLPGTKREASKEIVNSCLVLLSRGRSS